MFFFFNDTATTEIYTLSLHDALPIFWNTALQLYGFTYFWPEFEFNYTHWIDGPITTKGKNQLAVTPGLVLGDRKSTRLNSSHLVISYAVFCLKKKKISNASHTAHARS